MAKDSKSNPTSIRFICTLMERLGYVNFHHHAPWRDRLQQVYCHAQHCTFILFLTLHLGSTIARSRRYLPEFFQNFLEDAIFIKNLQGAQMLLRSSAEVDDLVNFMERSFSQANVRIVQKHKKRARVIFYVYMTIVICVLVSNAFERLLPLSRQELEKRQMIYPGLHPERRLLANVLIPFLDETQSWYFEVIYVWQIYLCTMLVPTLATAVTLLPVIVTHIQGQYEILASYAAKIGRRHTDAAGNAIYYTDIERDQYVRQSEENGMRHREMDEKYQQVYLRLVVKFHQKLSAFESRVLRLFNTSMFLVICIDSSCLCLCLYQLTLSGESLSFLRLSKFLSEAMTILFELYYLCHCSEVMDDGHGILRAALLNCGWYECGIPLRRQIQFFLRRLQRPNHMRFNQGAIVLSRVFFLSTLRLSYSFVNCMRLMK